MIHPEEIFLTKSSPVELLCALLRLFVQRLRLAQRVAQFFDTLTGDLRLRNAAHTEALGAVELSENSAAPRFTGRALCAHRSGQDAQHER